MGMCRAQGEALNIDRLSLYEALYDLLLSMTLHPLLDDNAESAATAQLSHNGSDLPERVSSGNASQDKEKGVSLIEPGPAE